MFSIIMPVWDRADVVSQSIESVLSQTFDDYELIIVDDGSQDNLEKVVEPYLSEEVAFYKISHSGILINLRMVVMKQNETEISQLREASRQMGVDIFSVKTVNPSCDSPSGIE